MNDRENQLFAPGKVAGLLAMLLVLSWLPVLLGGQTFYYRDFGVLAVPTATFHRAAIWSGQIPLWNALSNCGAPFLAQWGTMICYPPSLIYILLPMPWSLNFFCLLHLWAGGMGMFLLARKWSLAGPAAAFAAVAFIFNGIALGTLTWPNYTAALALFPWILLAVERACQIDLRQPASTRIAVAALISAMQLLTGVPELSLFTWLIVSALFLLRLVQSRDARGTLMLRMLGIVIVTSGLVAVQMLPFWELLRHSQRTPGFAGEKWSLPPWGWANLVLPRFHTFKTAEGTAFQYGQEFLSSTYLGAPLLMLAAFGLVRRDARGRIFAVFAVLGMILALGSSGYLYSILTRLLPMLGVARYPVKFLFLTAFTLPILSAIGLQQFLALPERARRNALLFSAVGGLALMAFLVWFNLAWPFPLDWPGEFKQNSLHRAIIYGLFAAVLFLASTRRFEEARPVLFGLLIVIVAIDARTHLAKQNPTTASSVFQTGLWEQAQESAAQSLGAGRVFISPAAEERLLRSTVADAQQDMLGKRLALWSHLNLLDGVPKVNGSSTLQVRQQAEVQKYLYSGTNQNLAAWLDFLAVTLETSSNSVVEWHARRNAMPFVTGGQQAIVAPSSVSNWPKDWNPAVQVLLESTSALQLPLAGTTVAFSDVRVGAEEISFSVESTNATVAVIPQSWYPAWKYTVTTRGRTSSPATVLKANHAFQAVPVPAGKSTVRIYYRDNFFLLGACISVAFLAWCGAVLAKALRGNKNALLKTEKSAG